MMYDFIIVITMFKFTFNNGYTIEFSQTPTILDIVKVSKESLELYLVTRIMREGVFSYMGNGGENMEQIAQLDRSEYSSDQEYQLAIYMYVIMMPVSDQEDDQGAFQHEGFALLLETLIRDSLNGKSIVWFPRGQNMYFDESDAKLTIDGRSYQFPTVGSDFFDFDPRTMFT